MSASYKQIQAFVRVAESNTFADAADQLHITQPALSTAIKKLESELGGPLFHRTTRSVALTPEGKLFLTEAQRLLAHWDTVIMDIKNRFALQKGTLAVACMPAFAESYLPTILQQFHHQFPNIAIRVRDEVMEEAIESVLAGRTELGFVFEPVKMEGLIFYPLFENGFVVAMTSDHEFAKCSELGWEEVLSESHVLMHKGTSVRAWIDAAVPDTSSLKIVAETSQLSTVGQLVAKGLGLAIVPEICRQQMTQKGLSCIPLNEPKLIKQVGIIHSRRRDISIPAKSLLLGCQEEFDSH